MARSADLKTPLARLTWTKGLFVPNKDELTGKESWGCTLLIPKSTDITALKEAVASAATEAWGDKAKAQLAAGTIKSPFIDGDGPQGTNKKTGETRPENAGHWMIRVKSGIEYQPKTVNQSRLPITNPDELYSGCYGYAVVSAFTWDNPKNGRGVTFGITALQKAREGERLGGGGADPDQWFDKIEDTGDAPAETKTGKGAAGLFG